MPLISIIVPVYNVQDYIERCLESLVRQTLQDFELVLVDDCSPDDSIAKAEVFLKSAHIPWKVVHREQNGGLSAARNSGLMESTGEWVQFLDSDDELLPIALESMIAQAHSGKYDCVVGNYETKYPDHTEISRKYSDFRAYKSNKEILKAYSKGNIPVMAWNKLVRRDLLLKHQLLFKEGMINEDELWTIMLLSKVSSLCLTGEVTYHYYVREGSIMTDKSEKKAVSSVLAYNEVKSYLYESHIRMPNHWLEHFWLRTVRKVLALDVLPLQKKKIYGQMHTCIPFFWAQKLVSLINWAKK